MNRNNHVVNYVQKSSRSSLSSPTTNHPADIDNNIQHSITTTTLTNLKNLMWRDDIFIMPKYQRCVVRSEERYCTSQQ